MLTKQQILSLIPPPKATDKETFEDGGTKDIISEVVAIFKQSWAQTKDLAPYLKGKDDIQTANNIHAFIRKNVPYLIDTQGYQFIKTPSRTLHDSYGDCKSYSILALSILKNLGIKASFKFVSLHAHKDIHHVYVVIDACCCNGGREIYIDAVLPQQNYEKEPIYKQKIIKMAEIHRLEGIYGDEDIAGIGTTSDILNEQLTMFRVSVLKIEDATARKRELAVLDNVVANLSTPQLLAALNVAYKNSEMPELYKALISALSILQQGKINGIGLAPALMALASPKVRQKAMELLKKIGPVAKKLLGSRTEYGGFGKLFKTKKCKAKQAAQQNLADNQQTQVVQRAQVQQQMVQQTPTFQEQTLQRNISPNPTQTEGANTSTTSPPANTPATDTIFGMPKMVLIGGGLLAAYMLMNAGKKSGKRRVSGISGTKRRKATKKRTVKRTVKRAAPKRPTAKRKTTKRRR